MDLHICNFLKVFWWVVQVKLDIPRAFKPLNAWKQIFKMCGFTRPIFHCKASSKLGRSGGLGVKAVTPTPPKKTSQVLDLRLPLLYNVKELNHQAFILWLLSSKSNIGLSLWHLAVTHYNIIVLRSRTFSVMSCAESWHLFHVRRKRADKPIFYVFLSHFFYLTPSPFNTRCRLFFLLPPSFCLHSFHMATWSFTLSSFLLSFLFI